MTGIFGNLTNEGLEQTEDRLGGFSPLSTDAYDMDIKLAYAGQSSGGAQSVTLIGDVNGREYRETIYITNRKGENYYMKDDKKLPLPGFIIMDELCMVTTEQPLSAQPTEEKVVKIWDPETKKEEPKSVQVLVGLIGKKVTLGIGENLENKSVKNAAGGYDAIAETRVSNGIEKVFHFETKMTVPEARAGKPAEFYGAWVERNKGQQRDKRSIKDGQGGTPGRPGGAPAAGAGSPAPKTSLFGGGAAN